MVEVYCNACVVRVPAVALALVWAVAPLAWGALAAVGVGRDALRELLRRAVG